MPIVADAVAAVLGALAALHVYWAFGGKSGAATAVPERDGKPLFAPGPAACAIVAALLAAAAVVVWSKGAAWSPAGVPRGASTVGAFAVAVAFMGRAIGDFRWVGFFKRRRGTKFARNDSWFYSPLCLALGVGALVVALSPR
jgi:Protein of unknown function (DUF3995)